MCGIFGISGHNEAARLAYLGLYALQHRGEESCGIVTCEKTRMRSHQGMGLVGDVFKEATLKTLTGNIAIGHVRYSTTGSSVEKNIQPFLVRHQSCSMAIAHNGNLTNTLGLRDLLEGKGSILQTSMDSELIVHLLAKSRRKDRKERVVDALAQLEGAYSLVMLMDDVLVAARDPFGFRPLCLGRINGSYVVASETCALDLIQAKYVRDIEPGEIVFISGKKLESIKPFPERRHAFCIFEYIYFSRPDSNIFGKNVYQTRKRLGRCLAKEAPVKGDFVMAIPDSGSYAATGFAEESGLPLETGMIRNHYVGRTFIQPSQLIRDFRVRIKLNPILDVIRGKKIGVVEDSIVRGTTSKARIKTIRDSGAKEIHLRISCPPLRFPCFYGIDFPTKKELIASRRSVAWIREYMELDSLDYLSLSGMLKSMLLPECEFCTACFNGKYPTPVSRKHGKDMLEKK